MLLQLYQKYEFLLKPENYMHRDSNGNNGYMKIGLKCVETDSCRRNG